MIFLDNNGKVDAAKALSQILSTPQRRTSSFDFANRGDAVTLLLRFYQKELRTEQRNPDLVRSYAGQVIDWMTHPDKTGLLLMGGVGCGKTTMLNAVCRMVNFLYYSNISFERRGFQWDSVFAIEGWARDNKERYEDFMRCEWAGIDDMGQENINAKDFGNTVYPLRDVLLYRYEKSLLTIATTNLMPKDITERYGMRLGDRMREMFHVIVFKEKSYRDI